MRGAGAGAVWGWPWGWAARWGMAGTCWRRGGGPAALPRRRCRKTAPGTALCRSGGCRVLGADSAGRWRGVCGARLRRRSGLWRRGGGPQVALWGPGASFGPRRPFGGAAGCHDLPWVRKRLLGLVRRSSTPRRRRCCGPRCVGVGCCGESPSHAELRVTAMSHSCSSHGPPMSRSRHCRAMGVTPP